MLAYRQVIGRNLAVLGTGEQARRFLAKITRDRPYFTNLAGVFSSESVEAGQMASGVPILGDVEALLQAAREGCVDDIVVAMPWSADRKVIETIERLKELPVNVYLGSDLVGFDLSFRPVLGSFGQLPVFEVVQRPIAGWSAAIKRAFDFVLALCALLLLSPLLLIVAIAIKLDTPGPVFFMQKRLGFNNRPFAIYKFRSMYHNSAPVSRVVQTTRNDPRVTRVGRIIRATSIDELPQLLNVLDGSMSLVGPRPHALSHNEEYGAQVRGYFARHKVRPGITGWAQVNGYRGETEQLEKMVKRVEHDIYYAENWSILFDIRILIMTVFVVLFQKAAY
jgi:Undecaprenyl-phosphate glucose phosphotransferase